MRVPLNDLSRGIVNINLPLQACIARVVKKGWFLMGAELKSFEAAFAEYLGVEDFVGLANGTDALEIALRCANVGGSDKVIVAPNAGMYGSISVLNCGAEPVFADVDPVTLCISPACVESLMTKGEYKAVIVTHLYGQMADVENICKIAHKNGMVVIEDCAQSHGARRQGGMAGTIGDITTFSFYPTKNLGALGDGGGLTSRNPATIGKARALRQYGWKARKYHVDMPNGQNSRLDEIQAACLVVKLPDLDQKNAKRRSIWLRYQQALNGRLPLIGRYDESFVAHLCVIRSNERDGLQSRLNKLGIDTDIHYPVLDYHQAVFGSRFSDIFLPAAEAACQEILTLPCFPEMTEAEVEYVAEALISPL